MKEIPSLVILGASNVIESSMKESSTKMVFISAHTKIGYLLMLLRDVGLESGNFVMGFGISYRNCSWCWTPRTMADVSGCILSQAQLWLLHCPYILVR